MRDIKVASRYAKSLLGIAIENKCLEAVYQDMAMINKVCNENQELVSVLKNTIVKGDKKLAILNEIFKGINNVSASFVKLIVAKKREGLLADIANAFIDAYKEHHNIKSAFVTSAVALSNEQKENIKKLINKTYNSTIEFVEKVDVDIIGGIILRVDDKQVDESIKRKLQNLVMEFKENPYVKAI
jgi:F-type H+-transporting ATPase subunit delta